MLSDAFLPKTLKLHNREFQCANPVFLHVFVQIAYK